MPFNFIKYAEKGNRIVGEIADELGIPDEKNTAFRVLRAVLHALRNRISVEESFQLLAQLPMALKGIYVDGWKVSKKSERIKYIDEFIEEVRSEDFPVASHDFMTGKDAENAIVTVFKVLKRHISKGEIEDIVSALPKELKELWQMNLV